MNKTDPLLLIAFAVMITFFTCQISVAQDKGPTSIGGKTIAVTIDDLPLNGPNIGAARLSSMTAKLLAVFAENKVPVVGFVNESLLYVPNETEQRIALLRSWVNGEVELGNHTFSHMGFKSALLSDYEDDFVRGETVTRTLIKPRKMRYFRHPYLQMGSTAYIEDSFESFIAARGYQIAPVTVDILDWMFLAAYEQARGKGDAPAVTKVSDEYLRFAERKFGHIENVSNELFARPVAQILLLHANELNADNLGRVLKMLTARGYRYITLEEALKDPIYRRPDKYLATSDWLSVWSFAKGRTFTAPMPAEFIQKAFANQ